MRMAIWVARRPSTLLVASTTYQSPRAVAEFTKVVETVEDITNSNHRKDPAHRPPRIRRRPERRAPGKRGASVLNGPGLCKGMGLSKTLFRPGAYTRDPWRGARILTPLSRRRIAP